MPLNPETKPTTKDRVQAKLGENNGALLQTAFVVALAISFTVMGTPYIALGLTLGVMVALSFGWVR